MTRTSSETEHYHGQDTLKSAAPFFNQSNCIIYALIQSEMEPQTLGPFVRDNAIFKTMCTDSKGWSGGDIMRHNAIEAG